MAICGKHIIAAAYILFFISILSIGNFSLAAANNVPTGLDKAFNTQSNMPLEVTAVQGSGYNTTANFKTIISKIITMALELMGVIFLILGIYGGYTWMTAGGNEEAVEKAKKTIVHAVIGLVIVLAAYAISRFVVETIGGLVFTK